MSRLSDDGKQSGYFVATFSRLDGSPWMIYLIPLNAGDKTIRSQTIDNRDALTVNGILYHPSLDQTTVVFQTDDVRRTWQVDTHGLATLQHTGDPSAALSAEDLDSLIAQGG